MMIHVVSTCIPDRGEKPCQPNVFATLAEAEAFADQMLRNEWDTAALEDDDGNALPYPGDWRAANDAIAASYDDGSWGEWDLTSHKVASPAHDALAQMRAAYSVLHDRVSPIVEGDVVWSEAERAALADMLETCCEADARAAAVLAGQDAPDASPSAPQMPDASALMLAALRLAAERIEMNNYGGEEDEHLAVIRAAIAAANGEA